LANFEIAMRGQRHHRHDADLLQREIEIDKLDLVRKLHHDPVGRLQAEIEEIERERRGAGLDLFVAGFCIAVDHRDARAIAVAALLPHARQCLVFPIALGAVARGKFGRERNEAVQHAAYVVLAKPPSMTTVSPLTKRLPMMSESMVSATSSGVTQRASGVALA